MILVRVLPLVFAVSAAAVAVVAGSAFAESLPRPQGVVTVGGCYYDDAYRVDENDKATKIDDANIAMMVDTGSPSPGSTESPVKCDGKHPLVSGTTSVAEPLCVGRVVCDASHKVKPGSQKRSTVEGYIALDVVCPAIQAGGQFACPASVTTCMTTNLLQKFSVHPDTRELQGEYKPLFVEGKSSLGVSAGKSETSVIR